MATTSPDNIYSPNSSDQYALVQDLGAMAQSVQSAISRRGNYFVGTGSQRQAFTPEEDGVRWQDTDGSRLSYIWRDGGWVGGVQTLASGQFRAVRDGDWVQIEFNFSRSIPSGHTELIAGGLLDTQFLPAFTVPGVTARGVAWLGGAAYGNCALLNNGSFYVANDGSGGARTQATGILVYRV